MRFSAGITELLTDAGRIFIEVGPGVTLSTFTAQHAKDAQPAVIASLGHPQKQESAIETMLLALGRYWTAGGEVDWPRLFVRQRRYRVILPTYPFERKRHWIESPTPDSAPNMMASPLAPPEPVTAPGDVKSRPSEGDGYDRGRAAILKKAIGIVADLSGMSPDILDTPRTFLELGFDSLLLTQVSTRLQREFGTPIKFRQLFGELGSPQLLVDHLVREVRIEEFALDSRDSSNPTASRPLEQAEPPTNPEERASFVEQVIAEQLEIMRQQLAVLRGQSAVPPAAAVTLDAPYSESRDAVAPSASGEGSTRSTDMFVPAPLSVVGPASAPADAGVASDIPVGSAVDGAPPTPDARLGRDPQGNPGWYRPDPDRPGKYIRVGD